MKKVYYSLLLLFIATTTFSQGIAIQGIARDNANSAITDTNLTFTFSITKSDNSIVYSETQAIKTDSFGVFSHIVSTGNPTTSAFSNVDFSITDLKMKVLVVYQSNSIEVYNQTFQYSPYSFFAQKAALATNAINADNGVPTGSIMPYLGATAPEGWVLCDGRAIPTINTALRTLLGTTTTPDLRGLFLRGTGQSVWGPSSTGPALRTYQDGYIEAHTHSSGTYETDYSGTHNHANGVYNKLLRLNSNPVVSATPTGFDATPGELDVFNSGTISPAGNHNHTLVGFSGSTGGTETRPVNYGVNYIIKL